MDILNSILLLLILIILSILFIVVSRYIRKNDKNLNKASNAIIDITSKNALIPNETAVNLLPNPYKDATAIEFRSDISSDNIVFKRLINDTLNEIDEYIQINSSPINSSGKDSNIGVNLASGFTSAFVQVGTISALNPNGLFTATVNPSFLTKFTDGTLSTMIHGSNGIARHAGFKLVSTSVFTPIITFQVLSFVTGQYYLNNITKQLERINQKLDELIELHYIEREAKVVGAFNYMRELSESNYPLSGERDFLKNIQNELKNIHEEQDIKLRRISSNKTKKSWWTKRSIENLKSQYDADRFNSHLEMKIKTKELLLVSKLVELKLNAQINDGEKITRSKKNVELVENVKKQDLEGVYEKYFNDINSISEKYYSSRTEICQEICEGAWIYEDLAKKTKDKVAMDKEEAGGILSNGKKFISDGVKMIESFDSPIAILYTPDDAGGKFYVKKSDYIKNIP